MMSRNPRERISRLYRQFLEWRRARCRYRPVKIDLALPAIYRKGILMPNFELASDEVATVTIIARDTGGDIVPAPNGDVFTAVSSNPASLGVAVNGNTEVWTPLVVASPGITVTTSDSAGLVVSVQIVDIVADTTPKAVGLDLANVVLTPQATPTNPGP
jgi:hypothetical protein